MPPSGTTGPLAGGANGSEPPELASDGAANVVSAAAAASTAASAPDSTRVTRAGPAPAAGRRRSHSRPASARPAATATMAALIASTRPYQVVNRSGSGTSSSASVTPVATTRVNSHAATRAYALTRPCTAAGSARQ